MSTIKAISIDTTVVKNSEIISSNMDNETVMMSIEKGEYYGINSVGSRIWELIDSPEKVKDICKTMCEEFNVTPGQCRDDVVYFLNKMAGKGIITIVDE